MTTRSRDVTTAELAILEKLWENEFVTLKQLAKWLYGGETASNISTVQKLVSRLESKGFVERDRNQATKEARAVERSMQECTDDLSEALPILNSAIRALNTLTSSDITAVKAMLNPPAGVRLVMSAVCIMLQVAPDRVKDVEHPTKKIDDFWGPARRLLADYNFLDRLKS